MTVAHHLAPLISVSAKERRSMADPVSRVVTGHDEKDLLEVQP
jgi:hypothetical protein